MYGALLTAATGLLCVSLDHHSAAILILEVKSHVSEWSLWSGHQCVWMFADNECADRLAAKAAEAHLHSEWTIKKIAGVRRLARTVQRRVATVTLHMAEQYPNTSILLSHVAIPRERVPLEESGCLRMRLWRGAGVGFVKCIKCLQVCGKKHLRAAAQAASPRTAAE